MRDDIMSKREFTEGILSLANNDAEKLRAIRIAAGYIEASKDAKRACSIMLREDLAELETEPNKNPPTGYAA